MPESHERKILVTERVEHWVLLLLLLRSLLLRPARLCGDLLLLLLLLWRWSLGQVDFDLFSQLQQQLSPIRDALMQRLLRLLVKYPHSHPPSGHDISRVRLGFDCPRYVERGARLCNLWVVRRSAVGQRLSEVTRWQRDCEADSGQSRAGRARNEPKPAGLRGGAGQSRVSVQLEGHAHRPPSCR